MWSHTDPLLLSDTKDKNTANKKVANNLCQTTHPAVAPDCSFAETKWFFLQKAEKYFHYQVFNSTYDTFQIHTGNSCVPF